MSNADQKVHLTTPERLASVDEPCLSHPDDGRHECMPGERRCVYCARPLLVSCNGCGQFLSVEEIHRFESRCGACA